jgi:hypothetical protein
MRQLFMAVYALMLFSTFAGAQVSTGSISGTVSDEQGGVLPGVTVTLQGTDRSTTAVSDDAGKFRFLSLPPGPYTVTFTLQGFRTVVREAIEVRVGSNAELPIALRLATVQETVTVSGDSPLIDSRQMGTTTNFTADELLRVPNSRDPWALLRTVPGVVMDRVNIGGNETGQQSTFVGKAARTQDAVWTLDGVEITDMAATGASPTYFDYDAFEEIQISTSGNDIRQRTGGIGLNFVVKRGSNQMRGMTKGYFTGAGLEGCNVPDELSARGVGCNQSDHNDQISELGAEFGGPIARDRAWFWASYVNQDIRLVRSAGNLIDRTLLKTTNVKGNWQATRRDMISVLWFLGAKEKANRATGAQQVEPSSARWFQGNAYPEGAPHGLLKFQDDRVMSSSNFLSLKYAYYGTGFSLTPQGGMDVQSGQSSRLGQTFGSTYLQEFLRPQWVFNADGNHFANVLGSSHDLKYGFSWRRTESFARVLYPGNMVEARDNSVTDTRARVWREGAGTDRTEQWSVYVGDTMSKNRATIDVGLRFDRQGGLSLPSDTRANEAFPALVPGISFPGYDAPFSWNSISPRAGLSYALDDTSKTVARASFSRYAGQLSTGFVGWANAAYTAGWVEYPWRDANGDFLAQATEVDTTRVLAFGGGFNPASPTAVTSANRFDADFKAPITTSLIFGLDRELAANLAVSVNYSLSQTSNWHATPWAGLTAADYVAGEVLTGSLPGGGTYSVPTFAPNSATVAANGNSRILTNWAGYASKFSGLEAQLTKRMSNRWMARLSGSWNNATEEYEANPPVNFVGNPTPRDTEPLVNGGQFAPRSAGSGQGDIFVNAKWQINFNGAYQLPFDTEIAGNLFGRQGNPLPVFRSVALGLDGANRVLVTPELDTLRFDTTWNLDVRLAKRFSASRLGARLEFDLFNVLNNNVELQRERNGASPNFQQLNQILSPRILRVGVRLNFY